MQGCALVGSTETMAPVKEEAKSAGVKTIVSTSIKQPKVLILIDNETTSIPVGRDLENAGFNVVELKKSLSGTLVSVMSEHPDLILLDFTMPIHMEPLLCRLIKRNRLVTKTPILLYSSLDKKKLNQLVVDCEAQGFIHKRWGAKHVLRNINKFLTYYYH